jgi:hypothetical protein
MDGLKCAAALSFTRNFLPYCFHSASTLGASDAVEARERRGHALQAMTTGCADKPQIVGVDSTAFKVLCRR